MQVAIARSLSSDALNRVTLPDDVWVIEHEDRTQIEKLKTVTELEMVKRARLETLEVIENMEMDRPSSRYKKAIKVIRILSFCQLTLIIFQKDGRTIQAGFIKGT